ncbi:hypothetical protein ACFOWB_25500, partial [Chenggangzhangella methanolivorans]|uniref:hypothetical protein n=1 Tax=Chenggangzhangella methanolivorans TaxID=1437009 RepID=UPI0036242AEE
ISDFRTSTPQLRTAAGPYIWVRSEQFLRADKRRMDLGSLPLSGRFYVTPHAAWQKSEID